MYCNYEYFCNLINNICFILIKDRMKKFFVFAMLTVAIAAFAAEAHYQYFIACGKIYATDANATIEQVLELIDMIEADCQ